MFGVPGRPKASLSLFTGAPVQLDIIGAEI